MNTNTYSNTRNQMVATVSAFKQGVIKAALVLALVTAVIPNIAAASPVSPGSVEASPSKIVDLGTGYTLVTNNAGGIIVSPARTVYTSRLDLGAGYSLEIYGETNRIVAPVTQVNPELAGAAITTMDIGAGYTLEVGLAGGKIIAPATAARSNTSIVVTQKTYIGGGYWLVTWAQGGQIVR